MKIDINPVPAWRAAPTAARITAVVLYVTALLVLISAVSRNAFGSVLLSGVEKEWWYLLGGVFLAYIATDTALLTLRGRSSSVVMSLLFFVLLGGLSATNAYVHFSDGHAAIASLWGVLTLLWLGGVVSLFTAGARAWRAANKVSLLGDMMQSRRGSKASSKGAAR